MLAAPSRTSQHSDVRSGTNLHHPSSDSHPPLLSALEETKLAERIKEGDRLAQEQLILANRRLVFRIVREYKTTGISREDLVQEGSVGLIRAAQNFDPATHGIRFSSYAGFWIRAFIQRAISNDGSVVRLPEHTRLLRERYLRALRELKMPGEAEVTAESPGHEPPSRAFLAHYLGLSIQQIERARKATGDRKLCAPDDEPLTQFQAAENDLLKQEERAVVHAALRRLSPFEAWVIRERFGLGEWCSNPLDSGDRSKKDPSPTTAAQGRRRRRSRGKKMASLGASYYGRTHDKLSRDCGLSVHRVRLIEKAALDKLRTFLSQPAAHGLAPGDRSRS